jgi:hypothetical protein
MIFGGGLALAKGISESGLAKWLGEQLKSLNGVSPILIPPPNKINTPQGSSFATSQSMIRRCFSVFLAGIINNNIDINIAIVPSATDDVTSHFFRRNSLVSTGQLIMDYKRISSEKMGSYVIRCRWYDCYIYINIINSLVIHNKLASTKIVCTTFSSYFILPSSSNFCLINV